MRLFKFGSIAIWAYIVLCASYLVVMDGTPYSFHYLHKALPVLFLIGLVWSHSDKKVRILLVGALVFSATGDVLLALSFDDQFAFGLGAFLIAHLFYISLFGAIRQPNLFNAWPSNQHTTNGLRIILLVFVVAMMGLVLPKAGTLAIPVVVYMVVIFVMAWKAINLKPSSVVLVIGALIFVVSDSAIAINKFVVHIPYESWVIMVTYYLAQYLLVFGFLSLHKKHSLVDTTFK